MSRLRVPHTNYDGCPQCRAYRREQQRARRARMETERVLVEGRMVHPTAKHGASGYNNSKCRCEVCTKAQREHKRAERLRQRASKEAAG